MQAMDLIGRKVVANGGKLFELFASEVSAFIEGETDNADLANFVKPLAASLERLSDATEFVVNGAKDHPNAMGSAAVESCGASWADPSEYADSLSSPSPEELKKDFVAEDESSSLRLFLLGG